ncbi:Gfo/Idh/MocA family protein [Planctomicrobium sp. SH664]|uniref:Gfo/Idh/MocA family protein n=1 Tax=Planctomicrobium sp. SH664 TaxID=3448125 RepID=UPI003F5CA073
MPASSHKIVILGAGSIGERHLRCFLATERAQVGFVEPRAELAAEIASRYPSATLHASLSAAIAEGVQSAVIATPAPLHLPQANELVSAGLHVLIEKPLSINLTGVDQLLEARARTERIVAVAYVYRANPVLTEMRQALQSGRYGLPLQLVATCGQHFPTYRPTYHQTYYTRRESGGGAVQDALTHILNVGEWLVGPIDRVVADVGHQVLPHVDVEDTAHVLARHGQVMGNYTLNQHQAPNEVTITVACERGTLRFESHQARWRVMETPDTPWTDSAPVTLARDTLFIRQANSFLDAIEGRAAPLCSLEEGIATLQTNLAVLASADQGTWQQAPGKQEPA